MSVSTRKSRFFGQADRILGKTAAAVAAAAGAGLVGQAQEAQAQVVYSGPVSIQIPLTTAGVYLNVVTGVFSPTPAGAPGWDVNPFSSSTLSHFAPSTPAGTHGFINNFPGGTSATLVDNLPIGAPVDNTLGYTWTTNGGSENTGPTAWNFNSSNNFAGFRFLDETAQQRFGWYQIQLGASFIDPARFIVGYGYEASGATSLVGAGIPEPTSLALLSVGAVGLGAYRRYRRKTS